jgi:cytochrome c-type biogenesis protein CcmH/NrfF
VAGAILLGALAVLSLGVVPFAAAQSAKTSLEDPALAEAFNRISDRLVCQCGCNLVLRVCNHENCPSAIPMRREIEEKLLAGVPEDSIVAGFVSRYGLKVLSAPPAEGVNLAAWVMPGFALLVGGLVVTIALRVWLKRRKSRLSLETSGPVDPRLRARIEEELERWEEE